MVASYGCAEAKPNFWGKSLLSHLFQATCEWIGGGAWMPICIPHTTVHCTKIFDVSVDSFPALQQQNTVLATLACRITIWKWALVYNFLNYCIFCASNLMNCHLFSITAGNVMLRYIVMYIARYCKCACRNSHTCVCNFWVSGLQYMHFTHIL